MKRALSWTEQVQAAQKEVGTWPESVKTATDFRHSDFFQDVDDHSCISSRGDEKKHHEEIALDA